MTKAQRMKASEKQAVCKKLTAALKKRYKLSLPKKSRPVLETILFGICLEDAPLQDAEEAYERLYADFHDLNEIRVSSITELEQVFNTMQAPEWRALRIRNSLHFVFEKHFSYDFEILRRKTHDLAAKQLSKINGLSAFVKTYTLQASLGSHVIPVDESMTNAAIWLGLVPSGLTPAKASEALKPALRKNDAPLFCHLLRCLATDPKIACNLQAHVQNSPEDGFDPHTAIARLPELLKKPPAPKKTTAKKTTAKKTAAKKSSAKKNTKKKVAVKKAVKKAAAKKKTPKKVAKKKAPKPVAKKTKKKTASKTTPAKKSSAKKKKKKKTSR